MRRFYIRPSEFEIEQLKALDPRHGPALGLFGKPVFPTCHGPLAVGDLLLLFTDGLFEVGGPDHTEYGQARLLEAIRRHGSLPAEKLIETLIGEVQWFARKRDFEDDVCVVGVEVQRVGPAG